MSRAGARGLHTYTHLLYVALGEICLDQPDPNFSSLTIRREVSYSTQITNTFVFGNEAETVFWFLKDVASSLGLPASDSAPYLFTNSSSAPSPTGLATTTSSEEDLLSTWVSRSKS